MVVEWGGGNHAPVFKPLHCGAEQVFICLVSKLTLTSAPLNIQGFKMVMKSQEDEFKLTAKKLQ